jgi:hypothetical protein
MKIVAWVSQEDLKDMKTHLCNLKDKPEIYTKEKNKKLTLPDVPLYMLDNSTSKDVL